MGNNLIKGDTTHLDRCVVGICATIDKFTIGDKSGNELNAIVTDWAKKHVDLLDEIHSFQVIKQQEKEDEEDEREREEDEAENLKNKQNADARNS